MFVDCRHDGKFHLALVQGTPSSFNPRVMQHIDIGEIPGVNAESIDDMAPEQVATVFEELMQTAWTEVNLMCCP